MASVDWANRLITVTQADMTDVNGVLTLDLDLFHVDLQALETTEGLLFPPTHIHSAPAQVAETLYAPRTVVIVNDYQVQFETATPYAVNVIGGNSNLPDVLVPQPGVAIQFNTWGMVTAPDPAALAAAVWDALVANHLQPGSLGEAVNAAASLLEAPQEYHVEPGSVGESIDVAAGLLDAAQTDHNDPGTVGASIAAGAAGGGAGGSGVAPHLSCSYNSALDVIALIVWLSNNDEMVVAPTAMTVTWRDSAGVALFVVTEANMTLTPSGYYSGTTAYVLVPDQVYMVDVEVSDGTGTYRSSHSVATS